ncbi:MAG: hypothetical protein WA921_10600 [Ahrensia sp.]
MAQKQIGKYVSLSRIALDFVNPRHEPMDSPEDVVEYLCKNEDVLPLARDISKHGVNPLELLAVLPGMKRGTYIAKEGNRRVCALKLLTDPDLAPPNMRQSFEKLAAQWEPVQELPVVEFENQEQIDVWLQRIHNGANKGIGRKQWKADQQARHTGENRNKVALDILDYAEDEGMIKPEQRKNRITTVQRFVGNPVMREALGIDLSDPDGTSINRPENDFKLVLQKFLNDLTDESNDRVSSRRNKGDIEAYARELSRLDGLTNTLSETANITREERSKKSKKQKPKPKKPTIPRRLPYDHDVAAALEELGNYKLNTLYYSVCEISLSTHTPLISVGVWSFVESLLAEIGSTTDMIAFFSKNKLAEYGFTKEVQNGGLRDAIRRISRYGNTTKHDPKAATFDAKQLANDFETISGLVLRCVREAIQKKA